MNGSYAARGVALALAAAGVVGGAFAITRKSEPKAAPALPPVAAVAAPEAPSSPVRFRSAALAAQQRPQDSELAIHAGAEASEAGDRWEAMDWFRKAEKLEPNLVPAITGQGQMWMELGRPGLAAAAYERALKLVPDEPRLHLELAHAYTRLRDFPAALRHAREAEKRLPDAETYRALASIYVEMLDTENCLANAKRATEVAPNDPENWATYGALLLRSGKAPEAEPALQRALELSPAHVTANIIYAKALIEGRKTPDADRRGFELLARARTVEPDNPLALLMQGQVLVRAGQLPLAVSLLQRAREADPRNSDILLALGQALVRSGKGEEGVAVTAAGQKLGPRGVGFSGVENQALASGDPALVARLADLYLRQGLPDSAIHVLRRTMQRRPGNPLLAAKLAEAQKEADRRMPPRTGDMDT